MPGDSLRYLPAEPADLEVFDTAISAIWSDRLSGRITPAQAVAHEDTVRTLREEWIMRHGG
jgi:hypothetical protein